MDSNVAIEYILESINAIESLKSEKDEGAKPYRQWREKTESIIRSVFGETSTEYKEIHNLFHPRFVGLPMGSYERIDYHKRYLNLLDTAHDKLSGYMTIIRMKQPVDYNNEGCNALQEICRICSRFSNVIRCISKRYGNRKPIVINDEYDVQYLLKILLSVSFDDIRSEETSPSYGGASSRIDFLLKNEGIAIETKMTRENLTDKEISKQLIQDIAQYQSHPDVNSLVCFIYDSERLIENPSGIIRDLESNSGENLIVKVVINPV